MTPSPRRKAVMARSIRLGHCVCDPTQPCPCETYRTHNVCPCAGERLPPPGGPVALTRHVRKAGCASKIGQADLLRILGRLPPVDDPNVLLGAAAGDDAGIYRLDDRTALVQTVDVFTPNVDDPYIFGQIAAANSLSDVYAMGGRPLTALAVVGFPVERVSLKVLNRMMRGGLAKMKEAGVPVIGGHSIKDSEIKYGFSVTGLVNPARVVTNDALAPGDALVLTKPLGTGVISFAGQMGKAPAQALTEIAWSMVQLNRAASEAMVRLGVTCATDVTGFGLAGHLGEMARQSGMTVEIEAERIPVFPEALELLGRGVVSGAIERNLEYAARFVAVRPGVREELKYLLYDPQTSGGLLIGIAARRAESLLAALNRRGVKTAAIIGRVTGESRGRIIVK